MHLAQPVDDLATALSEAWHAEMGLTSKVWPENEWGKARAAARWCLDRGVGAKLLPAYRVYLADTYWRERKSPMRNFTENIHLWIARVPSEPEVAGRRL